MNGFSSVQFKRYVLSNFQLNDELGSGNLVKTYKGKFLYELEFGIRLDILGDISAWLIKTQKNTKTIIKKYDNN